MIAEIKNQVTSIDVIRRELKLRFQEELMNEAQGPDDVLMEMVLDPIGESSSPLFFQQMAKGKDTKVRAGLRGAATAAGIPSRSERSAAVQAPLSPPLTSRGVTNRQMPEKPKEKILGGYDGGCEVGFYGDWNPHKFQDLVKKLEFAKQAAINTSVCDERYVTLGGLTFSVYSSGAKIGGGGDGSNKQGGVTYNYVIEGMGLKFLIHSNPKGGLQPIRLRYGFESLAGRDLFSVHAKVLELLQELGFTVTKEVVSRLDLQVMLFRDISAFIEPIFANRVVKRGQSYSFHGEGNKPITSYTLGKAIQLCIYDKREELIKKFDEVKMSLIVNDCLGGEFPEELTRVEFRLRRDALKYLGINTIQDMLEREHAVVDYLTFDWFRLLADEKKSEHGHERRQTLAPVWQEVRDLFFKYFPGSVENRKPIDRNIRGRREVKCTGESLVKQAVGCLATAAALVKGTFETETEALAFVADVLAGKVKTLFTRVRQRVVDLGILRGVNPPNAMDWHLDPRYACVSGESVVKEFNLMFDEDYQYQRVREYAVEGCPF